MWGGAGDGRGKPSVNDVHEVNKSPHSDWGMAPSSLAFPRMSEES